MDSDKGGDRLGYSNIVVFSDGTGNSSAKLFRTNVWRTYQAVDLDDPQAPKQPRQFAYYDDGVGTSSFRPLALLGGAIGLGLGRNVRDLYAFVCRTYRHGRVCTTQGEMDDALANGDKPADRIYAFGFSRGAFTVRVLAGLILTEGIVPYDGDEAALQRNVAAAYRAYRAKRYGSGRLFVRLIRGARDLILRARDAVCGYRPYSQVRKIGSPEEPYAHQIRVEFVGVWDTVAAYGLPVDELTRAVDRFIWPLSMPDRDLSPRVNRAMHALALDDERNTFHPQLWNEGPSLDGKNPPPNQGRDCSIIENERLSQVWFAGVHANVGGGYPDDTLSYVPLNWILSGADRAGLRLIRSVWKGYLDLADENGPIYDSRKGIAGYYRYNPRRIEKLAGTKEVKLSEVKVHEGVLRRIKVGHDGYAPIVLPPDFAVATIPPSPGGSSAVNPGHTYLGQSIDRSSPYATEREHVWNWVWWRRIAYFFTLAATLILVIAPLIWTPLPSGACESALCFMSEWVNLISYVVPGFATVWTNTAASHPLVLLILGALIAGGLIAGASLETMVKNRMRRIWYAIPATRPRSPVPSVRPPYPLPAGAGFLNRGVEWLRLQPAYQAGFGSLTNHILPAAFLGAVIFLAYALASRLAFSIQDARGAVCAATQSLTPVTTLPQALRFETRAPCQATGLEVERGGTYRIAFTIPRDGSWHDAQLKAGPNGLYPEQTPGWMSGLVPLRRRVSQPWFKPMARIGSVGADDYPLAPDPSIPDAAQPSRGRDVTFKTDIVARTSGELFLYVNDAVPLGLVSSTYGNNQGYANVTVRQVTRRP